MSPQHCHIVINGLSAHTGGGLTYLVEQVRALASLSPSNIDLTIFATASVARACQGLDGVQIRRVPHLPLPIRIAFEQTVLPYLARQADVVYCPGNFALLFSSIPQVVTFQNPNHFGREARRVRRNHYSPRLRLRKCLEAWVARWSLRRSRTSLAISESLRSTILEDVPHPRDLRVLLSAKPEIPDQTVGTDTGAGYALAVSNDYPHKDWDGLIELFTSSADLPRLVIVGEPRSRRRRREIERRVATSTNPVGITLMGAITDRTALSDLYARASVYLAHSRLEAFPLTPYEAMGLGLGVVASDIPPHREVCGEAAAYYPVDDLSALAEILHGGVFPERTPAQMSRTWGDNAFELAQVLRAAAR